MGQLIFLEFLRNTCFQGQSPPWKGGLPIPRSRLILYFLSLSLSQIVYIPSLLFFFINLFILFISFWLRWVFVAVSGLLIVVASLVAEHRL